MDIMLGAPVLEIGLAVVAPEEGLGEVVEFAADLLQGRYRGWGHAEEDLVEDFGGEVV